MVASDREWLGRGERQREVLEDALGDWLLAPVEHVGSTAVPGLPAKPILDLQAAVADLECAPLIAEVLSSAGWCYVPPEIDRRPWRRLFVRVVDGRRVAHLHVMTLECPRWRKQVIFRDALRADEKLVERYAALKRTLAAQHADDREAYSAAKSDFIRAVLKRP